MCLATASSLLGVCEQLEPRLKDVSIPLLVIHGSSDEIVPLEGSRRLVKEAVVADKTLRVFDGMLHSPLAEPLPVREEVEGLILTWIERQLQTTGS